MIVEMNDGRVEFKDLRPGETFLYDGHAFMKTGFSSSDEGITYLSVRLADGHPEWIVRDTRVSPFPAKVVPITRS